MEIIIIYNIYIKRLSICFTQPNNIEGIITNHTQSFSIIYYIICLATNLLNPHAKMSK